MNFLYDICTCMNPETHIILVLCFRIRADRFFANVSRLLVCFRALLLLTCSWTDSQRQRYSCACRYLAIISQQLIRGSIHRARPSFCYTRKATRLTSLVAPSAFVRSWLLHPDVVVPTTTTTQEGLMMLNATTITPEQLGLKRPRLYLPETNTRHEHSGRACRVW
jgi:hypothetical protein